MQLNNAKNRPFLLAIVVVVGAISMFFRGGKGLLPNNNHNNSKPNTSINNNSSTTTSNNQETLSTNTTTNDPAQQLSDDELTYKGKKVRITRHAQCRMDCRYLDAYEIDEVIKQNNINQRKSNANPGAGKCPSVAYEGKTRDGQQARIIVGECDDQPIIITVIDLGNKYNCTCN
ncbi:MAG: DUF4258 domain-containing protein [Aureispira sp.]|nr:DUF4258 domain-containing protein [Aureispira sp.]